MAEPTTISQVLPAPILEGALTAFTKELEPLIGTNKYSCVCTNYCS